MHRHAPTWEHPTALDEHVSPADLSARQRIFGRHNGPMRSQIPPWREEREEKEGRRRRRKKKQSQKQETHTKESIILVASVVIKSTPKKAAKKIREIIHKYLKNTHLNRTKVMLVSTTRSISKHGSMLTTLRYGAIYTHPSTTTYAQTNFFVTTSV